jgi:uncharacterized protein (TIGR02246 family)
MKEADLQRWLEAYGRAWETRDPEAVAALFTADARYFEKPFDEPAVGHEGIRNYWKREVGDHRQVQFSYEIMTIDGNVGYASWKTRFKIIPSGNAAYLDGIFVLEFDENNLCRELREWWFYEVAK